MAQTEGGRATTETAREPGHKGARRLWQSGDRYQPIGQQSCAAAIEPPVPVTLDACYSYSHPAGQMYSCFLLTQWPGNRVEIS